MTTFSVSTAPFFVGSLPQALPTRVLLLPPAPLGDVALPTHLYKTRASAKPAQRLSLCSLASIASVHTGAPLAPLTYQAILQAASEGLGRPNSSCASPAQILLEI